jgi:hypothetical protein
VLTVAVAHAIVNGDSYGRAMKEFGRRYPAAGYGGSFFRRPSSMPSTNGSRCGFKGLTRTARPAGSDL